MPVASLVLGIVGIVIALVPCVGMYGLVLTVPAVAFGAVGLKKLEGRGLSIAGFVCGLVGTVIAGWWLYVYLSVKSTVDDVTGAVRKLSRGDAIVGDSPPTDPRT